jgi:hypothetical protein
MTEPSPAIPSFTDGVVVHQADLNALSANLTNLYNYCQGGVRTQRPFAIVNQTSAQNILSGSTTQLSFNTTVVNTDNMWVSSVPTQLSVNTAGVYLVIAQVVWANAFSGYRGVNLMVNGTSVPGNYVSGANYYDTGQVSGSGQVCAIAYRFAVGATIYAVATQGSGSTQPTTTTWTVNSSVTAIFMSS